jgi:ubiquinone/menaquinone biosynthesis C-methylase UbiE
MHERRFNREIERLRDSERVARMEVERVVDLTLEGLENVHDLLDVGTGSGLFAEQFAARGINVSGVDANPAMLPAAEQYVPTGSFHEGTAEALPFPDASFDVVFMGLLLHETDDALAALQEAHRVVRRRVGVLEWPEEVGEFGPPAEHRLLQQTVEEFARQAGFQSVETIPLKHLVLYRLTP